MQEVFIKVCGHVQGVFFRDEAKNLARSLGLVGWVRNVNDGTVEIVAQGEIRDLKQLENWSKKGSSLARVEKIDCQYRKIKKSYKNFSIL